MEVTELRHSGKLDEKLRKMVPAYHKATCLCMINPGDGTILVLEPVISNIITGPEKDSRKTIFLKTALKLALLLALSPINKRSLSYSRAQVQI